MKKAILIGVPFIVLFVLVGWRYMQKVDTQKQLTVRSNNQKNGPANVVLAVAGPKEVKLTYEAVGTVESPFSVELCPKLTGKIVYLPDSLREGSQVKKGELLCQIDPTETIGQVLQAKSQLAQAQSVWASARYGQHPNDENILSQIAQAIATVNSNKADYDQVYENFQDQVHQAHAAVLDAQAKTAAAKSATNNAEAGLESTDASLADAKAKAAREETLYKSGYVAAQDNDDAIAAEKVAAANVKVSDALIKAAKSAEVSAEQEEKSAEDNEAIVVKTGKTNIRAALEKVKLANAALKYSESTTNQKPAYEAQLKADLAAIDAAKGNLNQANARLADCNLVSTIDGTISKRSADVGTVVNAGASILEIQYLDWLYVTSAVPVEYTNQVVKGTPVTMTFDALPGFTLKGTVAELSNVADPQSRQMDAMIRIDNKAGKFRPGMYSRVHFLTASQTYPVAVPREAVKTSNTTGVSTVTTVDSDNVAHIVMVTTGEQDTNSIAITDGINAGDRVVVISYAPVRDKQKVTEGGPPKGKKGKSVPKGTNPNFPSDQTSQGSAATPGTGQGRSSGSGSSAGASTTSSSN